jgi:signal transduction histidine kinase
MGAGAVELVLEGGHEDVPRSRAFTRQALDDHLGAVADDAALVVTELVTNALLHGGPPVRLRLRDVPDGVRLEVAPTGASCRWRPPQQRRHDRSGLALSTR